MLTFSGRVGRCGKREQFVGTSCVIGAIVSEQMPTGKNPHLALASFQVRDVILAESYSIQYKAFGFLPKRN
jgi:hypothetical protein